MTFRCETEIKTYFILHLNLIFKFQIIIIVGCVVNKNNNCLANCLLIVNVNLWRNGNEQNKFSRLLPTRVLIGTRVNLDAC